VIKGFPNGGTEGDGAVRGNGAEVAPPRSIHATSTEAADKRGQVTEPEGTLQGCAKTLSPVPDMAHADRTLNKTERLFALVLLLQNRPNLTSKDLADYFGVSRRTIFRDLRTLSESGVPLTYAEGGGYEILEGYQLPPLMFTAREAATLLMGTAFTKLQPDNSLRADADEVALKIRSVLPESVRDYIDRLQERTAIAPYVRNLDPGGGHDEEGRWYALSEAVAGQRSVFMSYYVASRDELTQRKVDPLGLVYYSDSWNLIAYDHLRRDIRNFRLDRIRKMRVMTDTFRRPPDFDLQEYLKQKGSNPHNERVTLRFAPRAYRWAKGSIPAEVEEVTESDAAVQVSFYFENMDYLARWLLRYGTDVSVVEPIGLRERLRLRAEALAEHYGQPAGV
jgi:predicted DNA-binding transcriptional regulator YafY